MSDNKKKFNSDKIIAEDERKRQRTIVKLSEKPGAITTKEPRSTLFTASMDEPMSIFQPSRTDSTEPDEVEIDEPKLDSEEVNSHDSDKSSEENAKPLKRRRRKAKPDHAEGAQEASGVDLGVDSSPSQSSSDLLANVNSTVALTSVNDNHSLPSISGRIPKKHQNNLQVGFIQRTKEIYRLDELLYENICLLHEYVHFTESDGIAVVAKDLINTDLHPLVQAQFGSVRDSINWKSWPNAQLLSELLKANPPPSSSLKPAVTLEQRLQNLTITFDPTDIQNKSVKDYIRRITEINRVSNPTVGATEAAITKRLFESLKKQATKSGAISPLAELVDRMTSAMPLNGFVDLQAYYNAIMTESTFLVNVVATFFRMFIAAKHLLGHGQSFGESTHKHTERPHFKSHPKNSGQAPTKSTTAVVKERKLNCWGCGREGHDRKICYFKDHPDFNKEHCSWSDSEKGKSWAAKGKRELRGDEDLLGKRVKLPKFPKKSTGNNDELMLCEINTSNGDIQIQALLDTGALDGNYISSRILEYLDKNEIIIQKERHVTLCGAFNNSCKHHIVKDYLINLKFKNELTNKLEILELSVTESDIAFDLIIGRQAIKQKNLAQKIPSHFFSDEDIHAGFGETDHLHPNPSSSTTVCTNCSLKGYQVGNSASTLNLCTINEDKDDVDSNTSETSSESDSDDTPPWSTQNSNDELPLESMIQTKDVELYEDIKAAILQYKHIFSRTLKAEPALVPPFDIEVDALKWYATSNQKAPRMQSIQKQEVLQNNIKQMLELKIIRPSSEGTYSQVHLPPKPGPDKYRFCIDFINLNKACKSHGWPIPNITLALQRIGNAKPTIFGKIDLTKGYYQCPLSERCKRFTAFISFMGCFEWNRVAMGLKGAGGYFQQTIALVVLAGLLYIICELYIDDILVYADNKREFVRRLLLIFERMSKHKLLLNPDKCAFGMSEVEYVGHLVSGQGINFTSDKKTKIIDFKQPMFQKDMKSFLGLANYFRDHILHFANITKPLQDMVAHYAPSKALAWDVTSIEAFRKCKAAIQACPTLAFVDYSAPIILETDASDYAIGAYLYQVIEGTQRPIHLLAKN